MKRLLLLVLVTALASLAFTSSNQIPGCTHVQGRLFNGDPGRMIGTITGTYWYDITSYQEWPTGTEVIFNSGNSYVEGRKGTLDFQEFAALDFTENEGTNGAVLLVVRGGTGRWEGATGHITLSGYFHLDPGEGEWEYQGEVCVP